MNKFIRLITIVAISFSTIACSKADDKIAMSKAPEAPAPHEATEAPEEVKELEPGQDISAIISAIKVETLKSKEKDLKDFLGHDKTLFAVVKPGCIFCESMLAVVNSMKPDIKPKLIIVMDESHAAFEDFKKKAETNKSINAEWVYDINNDFHHKLGAKSFPRLLLIDSKGTVIENQIGLVIPEDRDGLEGKPMPEVLQILSLETIKWMKSL